MTGFNKHIVTLLLSCFIFFAATAQDGDVKNFRINMILTGGDKGEILVDMKVKYSALYWDRYKRQYEASGHRGRADQPRSLGLV